MRVPQKVGEKGSLKWMQHLVNDRRKQFDGIVGDAIDLAPDEEIEWRSPLRDDEHAEYRDGSWLTRIGHPALETELKSFWPTRGPQWDALAVTTSGRVIIVEAKAHLAELKSPRSAAGPASAAVIQTALNSTKAHFGVPEAADWADTYYQYANRLAHLFFLRQHGVKAELVYLYVVNDSSMSRPATRDEWVSAIEKAHQALKLSSAIDGVHDVFVDVGTLA
jgi:hypothetical protein